MTDGSREFFRITSSSAEHRYQPRVNERTDKMPDAVVAPSRRYTSQAYFWTQDWQQGERLADYDLLAGSDYRPSSVEDLLRWLDDDED